MIRTARLVALAGALGFAGVSALGAATVQAEQTLPLANGPTSDKNNCAGLPEDSLDYWHFVLTPNNGTLEFATIYLNLGNRTYVFPDDGAIVPNGKQKDNVFVQVPEGKTLTSLLKTGTSADYLGDATKSSKFNLSHVCDRTDEVQDPVPDPDDETPDDEAPDDETPDDETPDDETPVDETPVDETPVDETPVDETPVAEPQPEPEVQAPAPAPVVETPAPVAPPAPLVESAVQAPAPVVPIAGELPETGSSNGILALGAALSLGAGIALVATTRRSRKA